MNREYRIKPVCSWSRQYSVVQGVEIPMLWLDPALLAVQLEEQAPRTFEVAPDGTLEQATGVDGGDLTARGSPSNFLDYPAILAEAAMTVRSRPCESSSCTSPTARAAVTTAPSQRKTN